MVINLSLIQMIIAMIMPVVVIYLSYRNKLGLETEIFKAILKMILQLTFIGFILTFILTKLDSPFGSLYILVMLFFALQKLKNRLIIKNDIYLKSARIALLSGSLLILFFFILAVINPTPKFSPQYVIPLYGMILGNTLTAIVLAVNTLAQELSNEQIYLNTLISLGVNPKRALNKIFSRVLTVAITPTLTAMVTMGLVSLPGMMTGQILSGTDPLIAIKYQIAIMLAILASAAIATVIFIKIFEKNIITKNNQLSLVKLLK